MALGILKIVPRLREIGMFYVRISGSFEHFQYLNLKTDFLEKENLFSKNWSTVF